MASSKEILQKYGLTESGTKVQEKTAPLPQGNSTVSAITSKYGISEREQKNSLELPTPSLGERIAKTVTAGAKQSASGYAGALNWFANVESDYQKAKEASGVVSGRHEGRVWGKEPTAESARDQAEHWRAVGSRLSKSSASDRERAKEGAGAVGGVLVDLGAQGVQMLGDATLGAAAGVSGLPFMLGRVFGQGVQEAQDSGADTLKQLAYGAGSAAVEGATEKISGLGSKWAYGSGASDDLLKEVVKRAKASAPVKKALTVAAAAAGESIEEFVSGIINPALKSVYNGNSVKENYKNISLADIGYDALIGGLMGAIGGTGEVMREGVPTRTANRQDTQAERETTQAEQDIDLPAIQNDAAEAREPALAGVDETQRGAAIDLPAIQNDAAKAREPKDIGPQIRDVNGLSSQHITRPSNGNPYVNTRAYRAVALDEEPIAKSVGYGMFADNAPRVDMYGDALYSVSHDDLIPIDELKSRIAEAFAEDAENGMLPPSMDMLAETLTPEQFAESFDPDDIVDGADAWDSPEIISWAFDKNLFDDTVGVKTKDGAIVWDDGIIRAEDKNAEVWGWDETAQPQAADDLPAIQNDAAEAREPAPTGGLTLEDVLPQGEAAEMPQDQLNAKRRGYPVLRGTQVVPFRTFVHAKDTGYDNFGLVVGLGGTVDGEPTLQVNFRNKQNNASATREIKYSDLTPVQGKFSADPSHPLFGDTPVEDAPIDPATLDMPSEDEMREAMGWNEPEVKPLNLDPDTLPQKAQAYLRRTENAMYRKLQNALDADRFAEREDIRNGVSKLAREYLRDGKISKESVDRVFSEAYDSSIQIDRSFYEQYKNIKDKLRTTRLAISDEVRGDASDFSDFRRAVFGTLNLAKDGTPIDVFYEEMRDKAPELFPALNSQADMLNRLYDVARSLRVSEQRISEMDTDGSFRAWAKNDFENALQEGIAELHRIARYATDKQTKPAVTLETAEQAYKEIKSARRALERAQSRNLLTSTDEWTVNQLVKGFVTMDELQGTDANLKGIKAVYEAKLAYNKLAQAIADYNSQRKADLRETADRFLQTANNWKDKSSGFAYSRETMERNVEDIVNDEALAKAINDHYFKPVRAAQAESTRFKTDYRARVAELKLSQKAEKGNTVSEAYAVQLVGEAQDNIAALEKGKDLDAKRDGKTLEEWRAALRELHEQNPNMDWQKIDKAVSFFRVIYDELFEKMNAVRTRNGYEPVDYRRGYFPHFQVGEADGVVTSFAKALGINTENVTLPTSINGMTHTFRPGIRWFGNAQQRMGFNTEYDAVAGFDKYIEGISDVIHQTDNIQNLRALAQQIRYRTTDEGLREQINAIRNNAALDEAAKEAALQSLYADGKFTLSNFVNELDEYTNLLANKKSRLDRGMESFLNRNAYNFMRNLESRVGANMISGNMASAFTNLIPLHQALGTVSSKHLLKGMYDTVKAYGSDDGFWTRSAFLTNRRGSDPLVKTWTQKAGAVLGAPMEFIDQFTADSIVRARYEQNIENGMSEALAMEEADSWAARVMAERSKGSMPTIFASKNPIIKLFTQFQLEVNNEFSYLFKDVPRELKKKGLSALTVGLLKYLLGAYIFNDIYEVFVGRRAALDPVGLLNEAVGDVSGHRLPNAIKGITGQDGFSTEQKGLHDATSNFASNAVEELPFVGSVLGGGRIPISSALPSLPKLLQAATDKDWDGRKRTYTAVSELKKPLAYLVPPFGGGQLKKIFEGIRAVEKGGSYSVDSSGRDIMQYAIPNDTTGERAGAIAKSLLFGKSSLAGAQDWVKSGFDNYSAKETAVYQGLNDAGIPDRDAVTLIRKLGKAQKTDDDSSAAVKRQILRDAQISGNGKAVVYYGLLASEKEQALMDELSNSSDMVELTNLIMQIKDCKGDSAKDDKIRAVLTTSLDENAKRAVYTGFVDKKEGLPELLDELGQSGIDFDTWLRFEAATSGMKKAETVEYIDTLPLTTAQKDVMFIAAGYKESTLDSAPWNEVSIALPRLSLPNLSLPRLNSIK